MKTIVISGACSNIGKTTLANAINNILPNSGRIKIGHGKKKDGQTGYFYKMGTSFSQLVNAHNAYSFLIIESNAILNEITPDLTIYLPAENPKPSAKKAAEVADITRGQLITEEKLLEIATKLDLSIPLVKKIIWFSGCRTEKTTAIIMTGGKSSRMGQDKSTLEIDGLKITEKTANQLRPWFDEIIISCATPSKNFESIKDVISVYDEKEHYGPLMGVYSSLKYSSNRINFIIACDIPEIDLNLIYILLSESDEYNAALPVFHEDRYEPLFAMYTKECLKVAESLIEKNVGRMSTLIENCNTKIIKNHNSDWYYNLNTPEQLENFLSQKAEVSNGR